MPGRSKKPRVPVHVTMDPDLVAWMKARIGPGKSFHSLTHAVETAVAQLASKRD